MVLELVLLFVDVTEEWPGTAFFRCPFVLKYGFDDAMIVPTRISTLLTFSLQFNTTLQYW